MTHDDQIKLKSVQWLFKHETVLPSLKDDCHPGLAHSGNHQLPVRKKVLEKNVVETLEPFLFGAVQPIQVPSVEKPITKNAEPLFQQFFSDTDDEDPVGRRKPQDNIPYRTDLV